jgi:hypothetical protein
MFGKKDKASVTAWAEALKANTSITELNLAKNGITANDTKILAPAIGDNGALTKLNMSSNGISGRVLGLTNLLTEMADGHRPFIELDLSGNSLIPGETTV